MISTLNEELDLARKERQAMAESSEELQYLVNKVETLEGQCKSASSLLKIKDEVL